MPEVRGIVVAVGEWYARTLELCLPRNMRHMTECLVATAPGDPSVEVARSVPGARVFETDAFTRHGARFNKGLAIEQAFDVLGRHGWILVHDADVMFPDHLPLEGVQPGALYGARRRVLEDPSRWTPELNWQGLPPSRDGGPIGFFQLAHADDPAIKDVRPWYDVSFGHAGGGDAYFMEHWKRAGAPLRVLPVDVLHLGPTDTNWFGTSTEARDMMAKFVTENGWRRAAAKFRPEQVARAGEVVERVEVPGYEPSGYELPFVQRKKARR